MKSINLSAYKKPQYYLFFLEKEIKKNNPVLEHYLQDLDLYSKAFRRARDNGDQVGYKIVERIANN